MCDSYVVLDCRIQKDLAVKGIPGNTDLMCFENWLIFEETRVKKAFPLPGNEEAKVQRQPCAWCDEDSFDRCGYAYNQHLLGD